VEASNYNLGQFIKNKTGFSTLTDLNYNLKNYCLIFDDVQKIYNDEKYVLFWGQIKALLQREYGNVKVFFVSSYTANEVEAINTPPQLKNAYNSISLLRKR
jgi:hypothetical protein